MNHKGVQVAALWCAGVGDLRVLFLFRIAAVTDYTAVRISQFGAQAINLFGHIGIVRPDGLDAGMAFTGRQASDRRCWITCRIHLGQRACGSGRWGNEREQQRRKHKRDTYAHRPPD